MGFNKSFPASGVVAYKEGGRGMLTFEVDAEFFRRVLEATSVLNKEPTIVFDEPGMSIVSYDGARVTLVQLGVRKSEFDVYDVKEKQKISLNVDTLASYLRGAEGTAVLGIEKSQVGLMLPSKYGFKTFEIPLLAEVGETMVPSGSKMKFDSRCKIDLSGLRSVARDGQKVGAEFCKFIVDGENIRVDMKGERGFARSMLELGKGIISGQFTEKSKFMVSLGVLYDALRIGSAFTNVALFEFAEKLFPCRFTFQIPFDGKLMLLIAPIDDSVVKA